MQIFTFKSVNDLAFLYFWGLLFLKLKRHELKNLFNATSEQPNKLIFYLNVEIKIIIF